MHFMIATEGNDEAPVFEADHDEPIWALFADEPRGEWWGEWHMTLYGEGLTYREALRLAERLGLAEFAQIGAGV